MAASIFWRVAGVLAALALVGWIFWNAFNRTTVNLTVRYDPTVQEAPRTPAAPTAAPAAPTTGIPAAPGPVSPETQLLVKALGDVKTAVENMDQHQQARDAKQDERQDGFERRLDALSPGAPSPPSADCPAGCISGVQHVTTRRN